MGIYIYKVTKEIKVLADGTRANVAVFAYKHVCGWGNADQENKRMYNASGCPQAERFSKQQSKSWTGRAVLGKDGDVAVPVTSGAFSDDWFSEQAAKILKAEEA